jgi:hypothetical protein
MKHKAKKGWINTPEGQKWLAQKIKAKDERKSAQRKRAAIREMKDSGEHYDCADCIHGRTHSCDWNLPNGCLEFYLKEKNHGCAVDNQT